MIPGGCHNISRIGKYPKERSGHIVLVSPDLSDNEATIVLKVDCDMKECN